MLAIIGGVLGYLAYGLTIGESVAIGSSVVGLGFWAVGRGVLFGREQFAKASAIDVALACISVVGTVLLLLAGISGVYALIPMTGLYVAYALILVQKWRGGEARRSALPSVKKEIDSFIFFGAVGSVASAGFLHIAVFLLRALGGPEAAGMFGAALTMSMPLLMVVTSFSAVFYPRLSRLWRENKTIEYVKLTDRFTRVSFSILFVPVAGLIVFAKEIIQIIWGNEFEDAGRLLPILLVAAFVRGITSVPVAALTAGPNWGMKVAAASSVCGALVGVLFILVATGDGGPEVAAAGYLVGVVLIALAPMIVTWRMGRHRWGGLFLRGLVALVGVLWLAFDASAWSVLARGVTAFGLCLVVTIPELDNVRKVRRSSPG
ncbi:lipopolysaccharide biosynthesis protein [Dietzia kunjamensis]|uniref:lipopolysaccharide biosynthesis protein n=1 Tax=Dietzia kunjamensis TaxID=322509 RepID=UPI0020977A40|nr:lipid II flippase MurJ [Dietzia kunjamensis]USX45209.1 oligosaccharide flippase family protein [Dietzia kunjamensis]